MQYATFRRRLGATFIDYALLTIIASTLSFVINLDSWLGIIYFILCIIYKPWFESSKYQGTVGKIISGIIVVNSLGQRICFARSIMRWISSFVVILPALLIITLIIIIFKDNKFLVIVSFLFPAIYHISFLWCIFDKKKQTLHDKIADTFVVHKQKSKFWIAFITILLISIVLSIAGIFSGIYSLFNKPLSNETKGGSVEISRSIVEIQPSLVKETTKDQYQKLFQQTELQPQQDLSHSNSSFQAGPLLVNISKAQRHSSHPDTQLKIKSGKAPEELIYSSIEISNIKMGLDNFS